MDGDKITKVNFKSSAVITNVGTAVNDIDSVEITTADGQDVPLDKYQVTSRSGILKVSARNITVTAISGSLTTTSGTEIVASSLKSPDGEYVSGYKVEGLADGHRLSGDFVQGSGKTGFQTWIDESRLQVLDASNNDVTANYAVHTVEGYITVNIQNASTNTNTGTGTQAQRVNITVTAKSGSFVYDGAAHTLNGTGDFTVSGLVDGDVVDKVTFKSTSTITNVGTQPNEIQSVVIKSAAGAAVDSSKYNVTYVPGKLTVTKFPLTLTAVSDSKVYDGQALNNKSVKSGALASADHKLSADYEVYDSNGNSIKNGPVDVGVYVKKVTNVKITSGSQDVTSNYDITTEDGTLTIRTASGSTSANTVTDTAYYGNTYTIRSEKPYSEFQYLVIDGQRVDSENYTVREGSTIITLKAAYIQNLKTGSHNYSIVSTSGQSDGSFTVSKAPKTSDGTTSVLWIVLLVAVVLLALVAWFFLRRGPKKGGKGPSAGGKGNGSTKNTSGAGNGAAGKNGASARSAGNSRGSANASSGKNRGSGAAGKKPVSDTVMDFETFFGADAGNRAGKTGFARGEKDPKTEPEDPTKDLLGDFRINLDDYREPASPAAWAAASAAGAAATGEFPASGEPVASVEPAASAGAEPVQSESPEADAAVPTAGPEAPEGDSPEADSPDIISPEAIFQEAGSPDAGSLHSAELAGEAVSAGPGQASSGASAAGPSAGPAAGVTEDLAATAAAGPAADLIEDMTAAAAAAPVAAPTLDELLAGLEGLISEAKATAEPTGGKDAEASGPAAGYKGKHEAGAADAGNASASGWYRPQNPDEKTESDPE